eukprot:gene20704-43328_t
MIIPCVLTAALAAAASVDEVEFDDAAGSGLIRFCPNGLLGALDYSVGNEEKPPVRRIEFDGVDTLRLTLRDNSGTMLALPRPDRAELLGKIRY